MIQHMRVEDRVLAMRSTGRSYGAIARTVGFASAREAHDAFLLALRRRPHAEQAELRDQELGRLDDLARQLRDQRAMNEEELADKLGVLDRLRELLLTV